MPDPWPHHIAHTAAAHSTAITTAEIPNLPTTESRRIEGETEAGWCGWPGAW
jgi:hypothetical protein